MNWPRISSGTISASSGFGASGIQLLKYLTGPFQRIALDVREDERQQRERERHRDRARRGVDPPRRDAVPRLARQRQRDEPEQVDHEDEEHQRRDVREPAADRLRRQALLGDLRLRDLVGQLADRLAAPGMRAAFERMKKRPKRIVTTLPSIR